MNVDKKPMSATYSMFGCINYSMSFFIITTNCKEASWNSPFPISCFGKKM